jgi:hypothetical protein
MCFEKIVHFRTNALQLFADYKHVFCRRLDCPLWKHRLVAAELYHSNKTFLTVSNLSVSDNGSSNVNMLWRESLSCLVYVGWNKIYQLEEKDRE